MSIIDNVLNTVAKEVSKVQSRGSEMVQGFNLQNQISELERKKNAKFMEIGRLIYGKNTDGKEVSDELIAERCAEVTAISHEISVLQAEIDQIKVKNDPDATPSAKAEARAGFKTSPDYTCPSCHAPASREKPFCPACGESLRANKSDSDPIDVEPETHN
ncbi:MAG: zinc ribbon domain-containing protein [Cyanobacteria bacterium SZAS LIN-2]|nr:zinc ribbon domain-containing protein [Cyanobacteria bacterium SZAS LIN-3]MBS1997614.1 zinc ribbon domain-containing protein [Cyanobacteria bacterium SZAS LIN-2]MBS2009948.1 zinc ribbon domain-containing protein [Cyanobacteria bacterium SZAS TMP-1]